MAREARGLYQSSRLNGEGGERARRVGEWAKRVGECSTAREVSGRGKLVSGQGELVSGQGELVSGRGGLVSGKFRVSISDQARPSLVARSRDFDHPVRTAHRVVRVRWLGMVFPRFSQSLTPCLAPNR
jgi:hypothetical protein